MMGVSILSSRTCGVNSECGSQRARKGFGVSATDGGPVWKMQGRDRFQEHWRAPNVYLVITQILIAPYRRPRQWTAGTAIRALVGNHQNVYELTWDIMVQYNNFPW
jgi:hypothetical protein